MVEAEINLNGAGFHLRAERAERADMDYMARLARSLVCFPAFKDKAHSGRIHL